MDDHPTAADAYSPREIARRVEEVGVSKAKADAATLLVLSVLAGAFISLGALFFTVVVTQASLGFGIDRLVGGIAFSLGLILVVVGGGELFTGNNLVAMAWASGRITTRELLRSWLIVYAGNVVGCLGTTLLVAFARIDALGGGAVGETAIGIAQAKASLPVGEALARAILCNAFVCLAVWLALGGRSLADKVLAIVFPISAFVAIGLEHSIANWFFLTWGLVVAAPGTLAIGGIARNLATTTVGNVVGGTLLVAGVYWLAYRRTERPPASRLSR